MKLNIEVLTRMNNDKIIITMPEMMEQMDISDKTLQRMIENNDLPDFTYGSKYSKKKGWHTAVLERHAMEKYEKSQNIKDVSDIAQVRREDVAIVPLSCSDGAVTEKNGSFNHRNSSQKKLSRKEVTKGVRSSSFKSRISAGFSNSAA
jgi:hypothetical protein